MVKARINRENTEKIVDFRFPIVFLRIPFFLKILNKMGHHKLLSVISWFFVAVTPIVAGISLYLFAISLYTLVTINEARDVARELGPQSLILIPGINPYLPIIYGLFGIIVGILVHEGAHGTMARNVGVRIKSSGIVFLLFLPVGAFVDLDEEQMKKFPSKDLLKISSGGAGANMAVAILSLLLLFTLLSGLNPTIEGLCVIQTFEGMPAESSGIREGDIIVVMENETIKTLDDYRTTIEKKNSGDLIYLTVMRGENLADSVNISTQVEEHNNKKVLGLSLFEIGSKRRLETYIHPSLETVLMYFQLPTISTLPFSDSVSSFYRHPIGSSWVILSNFLFWVWFINVNLAIFNSLPMYPLDGGIFFEITLKRLFGKKKESIIKRITNIVTFLLLSMIIMIVLLSTFG